MILFDAEKKIRRNELGLEGGFDSSFVIGRAKLIVEGEIEISFCFGKRAAKGAKTVVFDQFFCGGFARFEETGLDNENFVRRGVLNDFSGRFQIFFQKDGRNEKRACIVVETSAAAAIRWEFFRGVVSGAVKIAHGVVVFGSSEALNYRAARVANNFGVINCFIGMS